ncbi:hypothetical protein [Methylocaldum sp. RMAD-M]|jgi:hypothetical protein|uniref:hypothetical protein n=1 Tax=Methylocaldum sp. RMAD-M TaxID=2806557 RepID=UPI001AE849CC|nr:hypothetical protein [Methylocaldum sp. RMAD-M]MBP1152774.1 putative membrane protein [Methylocaldum sp. RMAD-M]
MLETVSHASHSRQDCPNHPRLWPDPKLLDTVFKALVHARENGDHNANELLRRRLCNYAVPLSDQDRTELLRWLAIYGERYFFPDLEAALRTLKYNARNDLVLRLQSIVTVGSSYIAKRDDYCATNLALNSCGPAPLFRPQLEIPSKLERTREHLLLLNDHQVIGLHWLWERRMDVHPNPRNRDIKSLFEKDRFDFEQASEIAAKKWTAEQKAQELGLSVDHRLAIPIFHGSALRDRYKRIRNREQRVRTNLLTHAQNPSSRLKASDIDDRVVEYSCLALAQGSPSKAVNWWILRTGQDRDPESRERRRKLFAKRKKELFAQERW